jgi:hypothetical protein
MENKLLLLLLLLFIHILSINQYGLVVYLLKRQNIRGSNSFTAGRKGGREGGRKGSGYDGGGGGT